MIVLLYIVLAIVSSVYCFLTWNYNHWQKREIPYPKPALFVGNLPGAVTQKHHVVYDVQKIYNQFKEQYNLVGIFNMRQPQYLITDGALARDMLINKFKNFHDNEFADMTDKEKDPILGRNPFMLKGEEWKEKRAEITPAFTQLRIKAMYPVIEDVCERLKKYILKENHQAIETREMSAKFTTDVVSSCIFGIDAGSFAGEKAPIREMGRRLMEFTPRITFYFIVTQLLPSLKKIYKIAFTEKVVEKFFEVLMKDAIDLRQKSNIDRMDYLHYLLELQEKKKLSELDMVSHAITFFVDGFETSSIVLTYALFQISRNKDVQTKLREEIRETYEKHGKIDFDIVNEMPYLEQVLAETLRLHPPGTFLSRVCTQSCELPLTEDRMITIDEGSYLMIPIHSIHRDERYFEDPEKFIPERFAPEKGGTKIHKEKGSFLPFGDGPRICLGMRFAQTQLKAVIVAIMRDFELTLDPKTPENFTLNPKEFIPTILGGTWLRFKEING
ncbi:probable cytochrome P450 28d1 [Phlebotomus argentipes]|uniref:probable cytochrome P450 28d1 n=1 Tax=Phlebotomus argentipes TaxID=94469 RepID=UPI002892DAB6|nr:probable cytochrome P450 28d1 [Phlebotomus argentipes]